MDYPQPQLYVQQQQQQQQQPPPQQQQQQQQQQQYPSVPAAPVMVVPYNKKWHTTKIVLTSLALLFSIIVVGVSVGSAVTLSTTLGRIQVVWIAPQAIVGFCWSIAELITICARTGHRGIHPGAHVALHLLLWLGYCVAIGLTGFEVGLAALRCGSYCSASDTLQAMNALLAFQVLLLVVHFILFVRACIDTHHRNRLTRPQVVMVPQNMYYAPPTGQYPVQQAVSVQPGGGYPLAQPPQQIPQQTPKQSPQQTPQQAHSSTYFSEPKELESHYTGSTRLSHPSRPGLIQDDGLHLHAVNLHHP